MDTLTLPRADDLHVHLRQDRMLELVAPLSWIGGAGRCLVMPNTDPPITTVDQALAYRESICSVEPRLDCLMTLYLNPALTTGEIRRAAREGLVGIKCYPRGVTTRSEAGVDDLAAFDDLFAAMAAEGLVLEIHGEMPSDPSRGIDLLDAEERFLPGLEQVHANHPGLHIVLEHVTTARGVAWVEQAGDSVAATITAHHLVLTVDDWAGRNHNFCKPVAKRSSDREALRRVIRAGHPRFFLGSDSAPHPRATKEGAVAAAGVFTAPLLLPYLADTFERMGCLERLVDFIAAHGCRFYRLDPPCGEVVLERRPQEVPGCYGDVVPFRAGEHLGWSLCGE